MYNDLNTSLLDLNTLAFSKESLKPLTTETMEKINNLITIMTSPNRVHHQYGGAHSFNRMYPQFQQQNIQQQAFMQHQEMMRQMSRNDPFGSLPFGGEEDDKPSSEVEVTIRGGVITFLLGKINHVITRRDGIWTYTITKSHYNEPLSYYTTLLCNEIMDDCK